MEPIQIKCYFNTSEIKRFEFLPCEPTQFEALITKLRLTYEASLTEKDKVSLYWLDDENEQIGLANNDDLNYAVNFARKYQTNLLKLVLYRENLKPTSRSSKNERSTKLVSPIPLKPLKPVMCSVCDQVILDRSFKSYVLEDNVCRKCTGSVENLASPLGEIAPGTATNPAPNNANFKKVMENLSKKISKDMNNIYVKNIKVLLPSYKMSELAKQQQNKTPEEDGFQKLEEINAVISTQLAISVESTDEIELDGLQSKLEEIPESKDEVLLATTTTSSTILSDQRLADVFLTLKAMGIDEDEEGCLKELVIAKNGQIDLIVESYFDLCFQKIVKEASSEKRNSELLTSAN